LLDRLYKVGSHSFAGKRSPRLTPTLKLMRPA
jgi:hypothetical protein